MKKVLVIGATGMVASRFCILAKDKVDITGVDEKTLDITNFETVERYFEENKFDSVINFAAFTNVDAAEKERGDEAGLTWRLNVEGPINLAKACKKNNIFFIHISTDFVFEGKDDNPGPYDEDAEIPKELRPALGWYAWTKNRSEHFVWNSGARSAIVRYGYPFRASKYELKNDWARNLLKIYDENKLYPLFIDQVQSVIFIDDLVEPLVKIVNGELGGTFHVVSCDTTTPYEIGKYILDKYAGKSVDVQKGSMVEFLKAPGRTPRPLFGGLKIIKTEAKLGMKFKSWREMADEFISQIGSS